MPNELIGNEEWSNSTPHTQVWMATHDKNDERLSDARRSFISFSWGDKWIEDFGLIATISGDRLQRTLYGQFNNLTTTYDVIDGQFFWGSHFTTNNLNFTLSTDGITDRQLEEFRHWFKPGVENELVLAEHPNRAIMARMETQPSYSFLPFEEKTEWGFSTTLYKGDINISFVMDDPFWYSKENIIMSILKAKQSSSSLYYNSPFSGMQVESTITWPYVEIDTVTRPLINNTYARITAAYDDNMNLMSIYDIDVDDPMADVKYINLNDFSPLSEKMKIIFEDNTYVNSMITIPLEDNNFKPACFGSEQKNWMISASQTFSDKLASTENGARLYYPGTASGRPIIDFDIVPKKDDNGYIVEPRNQIAEDSDKADDEKYNYLSIGDDKMYFTTPGIWTGYNQALQIIDNFEEGKSFADLRVAFINGVNEYYSRAWAVACMEQARTANVDTPLEEIQTTAANLQQMRKNMLFFIDAEQPAHFSFDSKTGVARGTFNALKLAADVSHEIEGCDINHTTENITENVGDMLRSNFLMINGRSTTDMSTMTAQNLLPVTTNYSTNLTNLSIQYKNLYLMS